MLLLAVSKLEPRAAQQVRRLVHGQTHDARIAAFDVLDEGSGGNSVFARAFLDALESNTGIMSTPELYTRISKRVEVAAFDGETARLELQVTAGFYVRSLAHDLGDALGCGAHLSALRRTRSGEFGLEHAVRPERAELLGCERAAAVTAIAHVTSIHREGA